jgi:hypothetical protein
MHRQALRLKEMVLGKDWHIDEHSLFLLTCYIFNSEWVKPIDSIKGHRRVPRRL